MQSVIVCFVLTLMTFAAAYPYAYDTHSVLVNRNKRQLNISDSQDRGTWSISADHNRNTDSFGRSQEKNNVRADASYNFIRSEDGKSGLYGTGHYQRHFGDTPVRDQYGVGLEYRNDRGSIGAEVGQQRGTDQFGRWTTNNFRADAIYDLYRSKDGNTRLGANGFYERSSGGDFPTRSDYGGGLIFRHNF